MWLDTHCHLDATEFEQDLSLVLARAAERGVRGILIPVVQVCDIEKVVGIVEQWHGLIPYLSFTLGIHPLYTPSAFESDLDLLREAILKYLDHPRFVGIGEIGLDYFVKELDNAKQEWFFEQQLLLARQYQLPVILHVRKSQDQILKRLRQTQVSGGIAHAFNGSFVQAQHFLDLNFKLGFGGTLTFERALQIRRLACDLPLDAFVLETDAPDIPPAWLKEECESRNEPANLPRIAQEFVKLRNLEAEFVSQQALQNALAVLPRWQSLIQANPIA